MKSQLLIQQFLASRYFSEDQIKDLMHKYYTQECNYRDQIEICNKKLEVFGLQLIKGIDEISGEGLWVLCDIRRDSLTNLATNYSPLEITFLKIVIDSIITADDSKFSLSYHDAIRKHSLVGIQSFKQKEASAALLKFQADDWLTLSQTGHFRISTKTLIELNTYLSEIYKDELASCYLCSGLITIGFYCDNCSKSTHAICFNQLSKQTPPLPLCLDCGHALITPNCLIGSFDIEPFAPTKRET
ncbi:Non-structural maintenance of chromosomes element 1-like protein [Smittium culicis]|uniref:Non-structural maintenance of chromosomes element 1 homolog n=1 Tax=Smittium culicis TaxID=133412 RepID=A0A1R1XVQ6_9FUNG|nr:Non-structural maintenance of chromosomes element 1-like protein [Smittium culicis]